MSNITDDKITLTSTDINQKFKKKSYSIQHHKTQTFHTTNQYYKITNKMIKFDSSYNSQEVHT